MALRSLCAVLIAAAAALAQQPPPRKLELRGDRLPGLTYEQMTPAQKAMTDRAMAGRGPIGTFNIMLRTPEMFDAMRGVTGGGADSPLSAKQRELAILLNGRFWTTQFEFLVHHRAALQAGLSEATANAIIEGRRPASMLPDEEPVYNFLAELLNTKHVRDATFQAAKDKLTERGMVDLMGVVGFYQMTSILMNVDRYPMQSAEQKPELKPLAKPLPYTGPAARAADKAHRFKPLTDAEMTPPQKAYADQVASGKIEGAAGGPFNVLLRSPELGESVSRWGTYIRFHSTLPKKLNDLAALITTQHWGIGGGRKPATLAPDEQEVYNFCTEVWNTTQVSDAAFNALKARLGERGVVEVMGVMGYYGMASMLQNIDQPERR